MIDENLILNMKTYDMKSKKMNIEVDIKSKLN